LIRSSIVITESDTALRVSQISVSRLGQLSPFKELVRVTRFMVASQTKSVETVYALRILSHVVVVMNPHRLSGASKRAQSAVRVFV